MGATNWWVMVSSTYNAESLHKFCVLLKVMNLRKEKLPIFSGDYPELDSITLIGEEHKRIYQQLVGMYEWMVQIGRFDIHIKVTSLNFFQRLHRRSISRGW